MSLPDIIADLSLDQVSIDEDFDTEESSLFADFGAYQPEPEEWESEIAIAA